MEIEKAYARKVEVLGHEEIDGLVGKVGYITNMTPMVEDDPTYNLCTVTFGDGTVDEDFYLHEINFI